MKSGDESMYVDSYRGLKVACPVDVRVWELHDGEEALVCQIVDNVVDEGVAETGLAAMVEGEVKYVDIPDGAEYRVEITATGEGAMDVAFEDRDAEGNALAQVAWADVALAEGESYELDVSEDGADELALPEEAVLTDASGDVVEADHVAGEDEVGSIAVDVSVGSGEGEAAGSCRATWGDPVTVYATPSEGWEFAGWYEGGKLVSEEAVWTFRADADRTLEARFAEALVNPFIDVAGEPKPTSHYEDILWLADTGISAGWTNADGTREFRPKANVARCDMAAFLFRLAKRWGVVEDSWQPKGTYKFVDVTEKTSHRKEVLWMAESGISTGWVTTKGAEFRPKDPVTRGQMAAFMQRLAVQVAGKKGGASSPEDFFRDVSAKTSFHGEIWWLAGNGVTQGWAKPDGSREFRPNAKVTRGDMAAFLHRLDGVG